MTKRVRTARGYGADTPAKSGIGPPRPASLSYQIIVSGYPPTRPDEFKTTVVKGRGGGVTVVMWNVPHKFKRSFQQAVKGGLRMRLQEHTPGNKTDRLPIHGFDGPNLAKEAVKDETAATFFATVDTAIVPAVEKHLLKALGGS